MTIEKINTLCVELKFYSRMTKATNKDIDQNITLSGDLSYASASRLCFDEIQLGTISIWSPDKVTLGFWFPADLVTLGFWFP